MPGYRKSSPGPTPFEAMVHFNRLELFLNHPQVREGRRRAPISVYPQHEAPVASPLSPPPQKARQSPRRSLKRHSNRTFTLLPLILPRDSCASTFLAKSACTAT